MRVLLPEQLFVEPVALEPLQRNCPHPGEAEDPFFVTPVIIISEHELEEVKLVCVVGLLDFIESLVENFYSVIRQVFANSQPDQSSVHIFSKPITDLMVLEVKRFEIISVLVDPFQGLSFFTLFVEI